MPCALQTPTQEAETLLTICNDDIEAAKGEARYNYVNASTDKEAAFWMAVLSAYYVHKEAIC